MKIKLEVVVEVDARNEEHGERAAIDAVRNALELVEDNGFSYDDDMAGSVQIVDVIGKGRAR